MNGFLAALLLASLSLAERPERPEPGPHPGTCPVSLVLACESSERAAGDQARTAAFALDTPMAAVRAKRDVVSAELEASTRSLNSLRSELAQAKQEIEFAQAPAAPQSRKIFDDFPTVEEFFHLHPLEKSWLERYPEARIRLLSDRIARSADEKKIYADLEATNRPKFAALNDEYASLQRRRDELLAESSRHYVMCQSGCRERICPPREP